MLAACYHPLEIEGEGDIVSSTGTHDCALEQQPCDNLVTGDYNVTYTAVPREGWKFVAWDRCGKQFPTCTFNIPASVVQQAGSTVIPSLKAVFEPITSVKPNILVVMLDDLGYNDLAINNGNPDIHTPNMDQLAQEGVRFTRHYAAHVCSPARAAFLTGLHPSRLGYLPNGRGLSPQVQTMPDQLRATGYTTWHVGKWHIGDLDRMAWPDYQGFDHWFGFLNQWRLAGVHVNGELQLTAPRYEDPWLEGSGVAGQHYPGHLENILTDHAIDVLTDLNREDDPWFLNLWYYAPHGPISPASEFAANYPDTNDGRYRALVNQLDHNVGRVLSHLDSLGIGDHTIVVVVSDNGGTRNRLDNNENNAPYYGFKTDLYEGSLRTPLIIRWPGESLDGLVFPDTISITDLYPTLMESIGETPPPDLDGQSYYQSLQQQGPSPQRPLFWEKTKSIFGILSADGLWRYYKTGLFWGVEIDPLMYDLALDPTGSTTVSPLPAAQRTLMEDSYETWFHDVHLVETVFTPDGNGGGSVTGMDFLRTPGFGPYTFGIGISGGYFGQIAAQTGAWEISRSGNTVMAEFGGLILSGDVDGTAYCHSIVVTGQFDREVSSLSGPDTITLALYIDGLEAQSGQIQDTLRVNDLTDATIIGDPVVTGNGTVFPPLILNQTLDSSTTWTVESFSEDVCDTPG